MLEARQSRVAFWSFFGFESDQIKWAEDMIEINSMASICLTKDL
jgi:hypothetical protein